jgi:hypothetical protein
MRKLGHSLKYLQHNGHLEIVADDVLNIVRRIHELSPRIAVYWNDYIDKFTLTETTLDGSTERLIFHVEELDERVLHRLLRYDMWHGREDPEHVVPDEEDFLAKIEKDQAVVDDQKDEDFREKRADLKERFTAYAEADGRGIRASVLIPKDPNG